MFRCSSVVLSEPLGSGLTETSTAPVRTVWPRIRSRRVPSSRRPEAITELTAKQRRLAEPSRARDDAQPESSAVAQPLEQLFPRDGLRRNEGRMELGDRQNRSIGTAGRFIHTRAHRWRSCSEVGDGAGSVTPKDWRRDQEALIDAYRMSVDAVAARAGVGKPERAPRASELGDGRAALRRFLTTFGDVRAQCSRSRPAVGRRRVALLGVPAGAEIVLLDTGRRPDR
jgi:hypothetical protein